MAKSYLNLVNEVLKRVREPQVGTISANTYSALVSTFVNDAKRKVEDAWVWSSLRAKVEFNLAPSTTSYDLGSASVVGAGNELNERSTILMHPDKGPQAFDVTPDNMSELFMVYMADVDRQTALLTAGETYQSPSHFALRPSNDSIFVELYETPQIVKNWRMFFKRPQAELESELDEIMVPWLPVVMLATNYALNEKGEEVGLPGNEAEKKYLDVLSDAISLDSQYSADSMTFTLV